MKKLLSLSGFTLMEIIVTVIIVGVIASFAIPNYSRTINQTRAQDAIIQLSAIRSANQLYFAKTGTYWPTVAGSNLVSAINSALNLNIIQNGMVYDCQGNGTTFTCTAINTSPAFTITVNQAPLEDLANPICTGHCP